MTITPAGVAPDFIVIGAMRAATTSLHNMLDAHPEIAMSREKESDFFVAELNFPRGLAWYRGLFPAGGRLHGESSTNYTKAGVFAGVPGRIKENFPGVRLIYVVRDPIARAVSHLRFCASLGENVGSEKLLRHVVDTSCYARQIQRFLEHFEPERFLVVDYTELTRDPHKELHRIGGFLGVREPWPELGSTGSSNSGDELSRMPKWFFRLRRIAFVSDLRRRLPQPMANTLRRVVASGAPRETGAIDADLLEPFRQELMEDARKLRRMLGLDFPDWAI